MPLDDDSPNNWTLPPKSIFLDKDGEVPPSWWDDSQDQAYASDTYPVVQLPLRGFPEGLKPILGRSEAEQVEDLYYLTIFYLRRLADDEKLSFSRYTLPDLVPGEILDDEMDTIMEVGFNIPLFDGAGDRIAPSRIHSITYETEESYTSNLPSE